MSIARTKFNWENCFHVAIKGLLVLLSPHLKRYQFGFWKKCFYKVFGFQQKTLNLFFIIIRVFRLPMEDSSVILWIIFALSFVFLQILCTLYLKQLVGFYETFRYDSFQFEPHRLSKHCRCAVRYPILSYA